jgi:pimeloyl-ACP methyl ester carboxylesterase
MGVPGDESSVLVDGPWTHRSVGANGSRFHVAEAGHGPLVLFLHGFPETWYGWRHQLPAVADAGFRAVAVDLRGYGASDKPPRGYDGYTMAADVDGLIRALGERDAVLVGHDLGGMLAWMTAAFHPARVRRLIVLSAAHPLRLRTGLFADPRGQLSASRYLLKFQLPRYEHVLTRDDAALAAEMLTGWAGPAWRQTADFRDYLRVCRDSIQIPQASFCALEAYRWVFRGAIRPSGRRFVKLMQQPVTSPTLHLHGGLDTGVLPRTAQGSGRYVAARYEWQLLNGIGHFPHQEAPERVTGEILRWIKGD